MGIGRQTSTDPKYSIIADIEGLDQSDLSLLSGPAFTTIYALLVLFTGPLSDNFNRVKMISIACIGWSFMTYLSSFATSFSFLLVCRAFMAVSMSVFGPTSYSLISDFFP